MSGIQPVISRHYVFKQTAILLSTICCLSVVSTPMAIAGNSSAKTKTETKAAAKEVKPETAGKGLPKVYDFGAAWCVPCKKFAPTFEKIKEQYKGKAEFQSLDFDSPSAKPLVDKFKVNSVPTVIIVDSAGKKKYSHSGELDEKSLVEQIQKVVTPGAGAAAK